MDVDPSIPRLLFASILPSTLFHPIFSFPVPNSISPNSIAPIPVSYGSNQLHGQKKVAGKLNIYAEGTFSIEQLFKSGGTIISTIRDKEGLNSVITGKQIMENLFVDRYNVPEFHTMYPHMCKSAKRSLTIENAGGKSQYSEALSMQYFRERFRARKYIPEMEIKYWIDYKMCDYICNVKGNRVGVSVSRAMGYPTAEDFTPDIAYRLLRKKLHGLVVASRGVCEKQEFHISVLHIFCQNQKISEMVMDIYPQILTEDDSDTIRDVIIILTVCEQNYIYTNIV